jgi:hypothetical protein
LFCFDAPSIQSLFKWKEIKMKKHLDAQDRGFALSLALLVVVLLLIVGGSLLTLGVNSRIISMQNAQQIQARCAADSGLAKALWDMNHKLKVKSWNDSNLPLTTIQSLPNCSAIFSYSVTSENKSNYMITSVGSCGSATAKVYAVAGLRGLFDNAILVKNRLSLMPNALVKGSNSLDPFDTEFDVAIGTTSVLADRIPLGPGTIIDGDVFVGVGGDPGTVVGASGTITGQKYSLTLEPYLPDIIPPSLPAKGTDLSATGSTITLGPAESGTYTEINLSQGGGNSGILEIQGGEVVLHITGNIDMGNGCELIVRPGSSLTLYIDGDISTDNSVGINNKAGNVDDFKLYGTGTGEQVFSLKAKSSVFGTVYAPEADITLYPNAEMYGAIVGRNVTFKSGSVFYYDEAVREVTADDEGVQFYIKRWYENELGLSASPEQL